MFNYDYLFLRKSKIWAILTPTKIMKTDKYTKTILTIIAVCLMLIVIELASFSPVKANNTLDVNIRSVNNRTVFNGVPVIIQSR